ncbi:Unconventional myosin-Ig [Saguinus oedipus]|uniref:Unconventional myosin-Ig n=1 Tax=Saguinus oedipus TaxID=9490 RepID=A0ABQ9UFW9_SAGOE|nr:Unconventional myosin-Ig [Saguinus oedipus]
MTVPIEEAGSASLSDAAAGESEEGAVGGWWVRFGRAGVRVTGLSVTSGGDQLVVLHARGQDDLVVCLHRSRPPLDNRVGELVGVLAAHCQGEGRALEVRVSDCIPLSQRGARRLVSVEPRPGQPEPDFRCARGTFTLLWPGR